MIRDINTSNLFIFSVRSVADIIANSGKYGNFKTQDAWS